MIVVDRGGKRRLRHRRSDGGVETAATNGVTQGPVATRSRQRRNDARLDEVSAPGLGSFAVHTARIPHPDTLAEVVAFLVEKSSAAHELLVRAGEIEVSFGASPAVVVGPVELVQMDQVDPTWFRSLVAVVYTAAGGTSQDLAMHEKAIGIPSTVVAFLRPERLSIKRNRKGATPAESSPRMQRRRRQALRRISVQDEGAA